MSKPLTKEFLISRGYCCGNQCENCPYIPKYKKGNAVVSVVDYGGISPFSS